jgi:hypothetical protein
MFGAVAQKENEDTRSARKQKMLMGQQESQMKKASWGILILAVAVAMSLTFSNLAKASDQLMTGATVKDGGTKKAPPTKTVNPKDKEAHKNKDTEAHKDKMKDKEALKGTNKDKEAGKITPKL